MSNPFRSIFWAAACAPFLAATAGPRTSVADQLRPRLPAGRQGPPNPGKTEIRRRDKVADLAEALESVNERKGQLPCRVRRNIDGSYSFDREESIGQLGYDGPGTRANLARIACRRYTRGPVPRLVVRLLAERGDFEGSPFSWLDRPEEEGGSLLIYTPLMNGGESSTELERKGAVVSAAELARANGISMRPYYEKLLRAQRRTLDALRRQFGAGAREPHLREARY